MLDLMTPTTAPWDTPLPGRLPTMSEVEMDALLRESEVMAARRSANNPRLMEKSARLSRLLREAKHDWRQKAILQETISTSDFSAVFDDLLNRRLLVAFTAAPSTWQDYVYRGESLSDMRPVIIYTWDGMNGRWYPSYAKPELSGLQYDNTFAINPKTYTPVVFERGFSYSWQTLINDDLGMFSRMPEQVAIGGRRAVDYFVTTLYADANGPHASVFTSGNANIINTTNVPNSLTNDDNPPLSSLALADGMRLLSQMLDPVTGEPLINEAAILVVPPALEWTARVILGAGQGFVSGGQGTAGPFGTTAGFGLNGPNPFANRVSLVVNPYLPIVSTTNGHTSWYLFQDPNRGRPAIEVRFLSGMETPVLVRKRSDMEPLGGGGLPSAYMQSSFDTGEIHVKGVTGFGGAVISERSMVASNGTGNA